MVGSVKLEQRFIADEKSTVYHRTGIKGFLYRHLPSSAYDYLRGARLRLAPSPLAAQPRLGRGGGCAAARPGGRCAPSGPRVGPRGLPTGTKGRPCRRAPGTCATSTPAT